MPITYKIFYDEIPKILRSGPKPHRFIAVQLKINFPSLCNDNFICPHIKSGSTPEWDHIARNAEQGLKRRGIINYDHNLGMWK